MYKIYINETQILLGNTDDIAEKLPGDASNLVARYSGKPKILLNYADTAEKSNRYQSISLFSTDKESLFRDFQSHYDLIEAAGGIIFNEEGAILIIFRRGFWDLPKGKIDPGESPEQAALREVAEETGLTKVQLGKFLDHSYHTYRNRKDKRILKRTHWYLMTSSEMELNLQYEEDIEKAEWVKIEDFLESGKTVYGSIKDILQIAR